MDFQGIMQSLFRPQSSGALDQYLPGEQRQQIGNQQQMAAAMALLRAAAPSTRRIGLGEAIAGAYDAAQAAGSSARDRMLSEYQLAQKMQQAKDEQARQQAWQQMIGGASVTPEQALGAQGGRVGPTPERAAAIGQAAPSPLSFLTPEQRQIIAMLPAKEGQAALLDAMKTRQAQSEVVGQPFEVTGQDGRPVLVQQTKGGQMIPVSGYAPKPETQTGLVREYEYAKANGFKGSFADWKNMAKPEGTNVTINQGQKGFENESKLRSDFKGEPIYKEFNDMKAAYSQVMSSLKQETPIGDIAAATKIMKLLDSDSVVRETELGMAMQATGKLDLLQNYVSNWKNGLKLTPTQRQEFANLSGELMAAAAQAYNQKRQEYVDFGSAYGLNAPSALGKPADIQSVVKKPPAVTSTQTKKPISSYFQ